MKKKILHATCVFKFSKNKMNQYLTEEEEKSTWTEEARQLKPFILNWWIGWWYISCNKTLFNCLTLIKIIILNDLKNQIFVLTLNYRSQYFNIHQLSLKYKKIIIESSLLRKYIIHIIFQLWKIMDMQIILCNLHVIILLYYPIILYF